MNFFYFILLVVLNRWYAPHMTGEIPPGRAAFGFAGKGTRLFVFAGVIDYNYYSNELYSLDIMEWEWRRMTPDVSDIGTSPLPRLGHSFTLVGDRIFLFGGLNNASNSPKMFTPK